MYFLYVFSIFYMYFKSHLIFDWVQKQMTVLNELYLALKRSEKGISTRIMTDNLSNYEFLELVGLVTLNSSIYNWSLTIYSTNRKRKSVPAPREWLHIILQTTSIGTPNLNCDCDAKPHGPERTGTSFYSRSPSVCRELLNCTWEALHYGLRKYRSILFLCLLVQV